MEFIANAKHNSNTSSGSSVTELICSNNITNIACYNDRHLSIHIYECVIGFSTSALQENIQNGIQNIWKKISDFQGEERAGNFFR